MKNILENLKKDTAVDNFIDWFGKSELKESTGEPSIFYCGTLSDFTTFDIDKTINDNFFGKGFYFSDSIDDINHNYSNDSGPDNLVKLDSLKEKIRDDLSKYVNIDYYIDILENEKENEVGSELYEVIKELFENIEEKNYINEDINNIELFVIHEADRIKQKDHDGLIIPVYLKAEKIMDISNHTFSKEEYIDTKNIDAIIKKINEYGIDEYGLKIELIGLFLEKNTEYSLSFEEFENALSQTIADEVDDSDYAEILDFASSFFDDQEIIISYSVIGELEEFLSTMAEHLRMYSGADESNKFLNLFYENFSAYEEVSVLSILENSDIAFEFIDNYIPYQNVGFGQNYVHFKGLCSLVFQSMGYDCIKLDAAYHFSTMKGTQDSNGNNTNHYVVFNPNQIKSVIGNNGEYSLSDNDILYRINNQAKKEYNSITKKECNEIVDQIKLKYPKIPDIELIDNSYSLDLTIPADSTGFYSKHNNKVFILLENINGKDDFIKTLTHEVFGHMSLKDILHKNYEPTMNKIYDYYNNKGDLKKEKELYTKLYKLDLNKSSDRAILAEEKMAAFIEKNGFNKFPLKNIIIGAIQNSLRKYIPNLKFNENDIIYIANNTHRNLKSNKTKIKFKHY